MSIWSPVIFFFVGVKTKVTGLENINKAHFNVYVSNHESQLDIPAVVRLVPVPLYFLLKEEIKKVPFLGWYAAAMGMIFVDRKNKSKAIQSLTNAAELIKNGKNVIVFPEGTRTKTGEIQPFKRGAFVIAKESNIGIIPMAIKGSRETLPSGSIQFKRGTIELKIGEPILSETVKNLSLKELIIHTENKVKELRKSI